MGCQSNCWTSADTVECGKEKKCQDGRCCSHWGYCGDVAAYCSPLHECQHDCWKGYTKDADVPVNLYYPPVEEPVGQPVPTESEYPTQESSDAVVIQQDEVVQPDNIDYSDRLENPTYDKRGLYSSCNVKGTFSLTFDDGPGFPTNTILDILKEKNVKATFFVVGKQIYGNESTLLRIYNEGHLIAAHSQNHKDLATLNEQDLIAEIQDCAESIKRIIGVYPKYFRPPYGSTNDLVIDKLVERGYKIINWNFDSLDWDIHNKGGPASQLIQNFKDHLARWDDIHKKGIIALQHDLYQVSSDALRGIIEAVQSYGYSFLKINQCFGDSVGYFA